jgi:hypothetical protein
VVRLGGIHHGRTRGKRRPVELLVTGNEVSYACLKWHSLVPYVRRDNGAAQERCEEGALTMRRGVAKGQRPMSQPRVTDFRSRAAINERARFRLGIGGLRISISRTLSSNGCAPRTIGCSRGGRRQSAPGTRGPRVLVSYAQVPLRLAARAHCEDRNPFHARETIRSNVPVFESAALWASRFGSSLRGRAGE